MSPQETSLMRRSWLEYTFGEIITRELARERKIRLKAAAKSSRLKLSALRLGCLALSIECGYQEMLMDLGNLLQQLLVLHGYTSTILSLSSVAEMGNWYYKIRQLCLEAINSELQKKNGDSKKYIPLDLPKCWQYNENFCADSCNKYLAYSQVIQSSQPQNTAKLMSSKENQYGKNCENNLYKYCLETNSTEVKGSDSCTSTYTSLLLSNHAPEICSRSCTNDTPDFNRKGYCDRKSCAGSVPTCVNVSVSSLRSSVYKTSEKILEPKIVNSSSNGVPHHVFSDKSAFERGSTSTNNMPDTQPPINENDIKYQQHTSTRDAHIINPPDDITEVDDQTFNSVSGCSLDSSFGVNQFDRCIQDGQHTNETENNNNGNSCLLQRFEKIFNELKSNILKDCG